jgi:hypothetical protein
MKIKEFKYSANFCEENIWHLCQNPALAGFYKRVLIVSNSKSYCPFRFQKSIHGYEIVWWNYHVILLAKNQESSLIYDFDSTLPIPISAKDYMQMTFRISENWKEENLPCFKAIDAGDYLTSFVSDRSHMKDALGNWLSSPPRWPIIGNNGDLPLPALMDFKSTSNEQIFSLEEMIALIDALATKN